MLEKKQIMKGSEAGELEWDAGCLCKLFMLSTHSHSAADSQDKGKRWFIGKLQEKTVMLLL